MEKDRNERYAESLERTVQNNHHYLKETVEDFRELCLRVTPERNIPPSIIIDIREAYKEIQNRLKEIRAVQQLLAGKYRQYARRDPLRDKEIKERVFLAKNCYSKFEYTLMQKEAQERAKAAEREQASKVSQPKSFPYQWFQSKENQVRLMRNLRILNELDYESSSNFGLEERREVIQDRPRSLTLFVFSGEARLLDELQSRMRLREHDVIERYGKHGLRGVLTHLKEINPLEVEKVFQRFMGSTGYSKLKCLLVPVQSSKDLEGDLLGSMEKALQAMAEGEVKQFRFDTFS